MPSDLSLFLKQMIRRPHEVVALAPSSRDLAAEMVAGIGPATGRVAELGAGTGTLTRAILGRGVAAADLTLFEPNPDFVSHLHRIFPGVTVIAAPAQQIAAHCPPGLGAVISGLPLLSMPDTVQLDIVGAAFRLLRPGGLFVQFTYGPLPPLPEAVRAALGLVTERGRRVWGNLPPARVYTFRRMADAGPGWQAD